MKKPDFTKSLRYAIEGFIFLLKKERNFKIHVFLTILAVGLSFYLGLTSGEWIAVIFSISIVFITEMCNTAIEHICDIIQPNQDSRIKVIKDVSAGFVLVAAIAAVVVGWIVLGTKCFGSD
jgi:diacylglycerol kinase